MKCWQLYLLIISLVSSGSFARMIEANGNQEISETVRDFLSELETEQEWTTWVEQNAPSYGNYCGREQHDDSFHNPCLSRLDCICKEHNLGYAIRRLLEADEKTIGQLLQTSVPKRKKQDARYASFLHSVGLAYLAAQIAEVKVTDDLKAVILSYDQNPEHALTSLHKIIDYDAVFRKKIEEIRAERERFEVDSSGGLAKAKTMSISIEPLGLFVGLVGVNYEVKAVRGLSFRFSVSVLGGGLVTDTYLGYLNTKNFSLGVDVGAKIFVTGESLLGGLYLEPRFGGSYESVVLSDTFRVRAPGITPALMIGFDRVFGPGLHVDIGVGVGYHQAFLLEPIPATALTAASVVPVIRGAIGWAW